MNLGIEKGDKNNDSSPKRTNLQNKLIMSIVDKHEKDLYHGEGKLVTIKVQ